MDDNDTNLAILQDQLSRWGLTVETCSNSRDALNLMRLRREEGRPFGLAILDRVMPEIDGVELAEQIRRDALLCNTRLLMLTSLDNGLDARRAERLRVTVLSKPIRQSRLFDAIVSLAFGNAADSKLELASPKVDGSHSRRGTVLIADDNEINRLVASEIVSSAGYRTSLVGNGIEAVKAVTQTRFDAVLMDCEMPEMDGFAATLEIRRLEAAGRLTSNAAAPLPIIALTAQAVQGDRQRCLDAGMTDYLTKPINRQQLFETLNACLAIRTPISTPVTPTPKPSSPVISAPAGSSNSELPCIDIDEFTERCMGKAALVRDLLEMFTEAIDERSTELSKHLAEGQIDRVASAAHSLKGMSANVSAIRLHRVASELEDAARAGQSDACIEMESRLLTEVVSCQAEIARLIKCTPVASTEQV